jgi:flagellar biosynthesis component FlhA
MDEIKQNKDGLNINLQNTELHQFTGMARVQMFVSTVMSVLGMILAVIIVGGIVAGIAFIGWGIYQDNQAQQITKANGKPATKPAAPQKSAALSQWRQLTKGQTPADVRAILGEPKHIEGGAFSNWTYSSGGTVTFYQDRVDAWNEPR